MGIPGIEELLDEYRIPVTGARLPILEKPYDIEAIEIMLRRFVMCFAPKGPWYPKPKPKAPSRPELPPLSDDAPEEISKVTALALGGDVIAQKIKEQGAAIEELRGHFAPPKPGATVGGMVHELAKEWSATKTWIKSIPIVVTVCAAVIEGRRRT